MKDFWSVILYGDSDRSAVSQRRQPRQGLLVNADGSVDVFFGPKAPAGKESNWVQTVPGTILRFDGPLEPWFNKTWRPGEIELVQ